jgi:hypothetical protein
VKGAGRGLQRSDNYGKTSEELKDRGIGEENARSIVSDMTLKEWTYLNIDERYCD